MSHETSLTGSVTTPGMVIQLRANSMGSPGNYQKWLLLHSHKPRPAVEAENKVLGVFCIVAN